MSNNATTLAGSILENLPVWFNTDHFAIIVTKYALGDLDAAQPVTALFNDKSVVDHSRGREVAHPAELLVPGSVKVDLRDTWRINGQMWMTIKNNDDEVGTQLVEVKRVDREQRTGANAGKLI
jgi:hypothetical protein